MPMLMTFRMRLPVWPFHCPLRTRLEKSAILSSTAWTWGTTFSPSTTIDASSRCAQGHVQHRSLLRDVDLVSSEHGIDPRLRRPDSSASSMRRRRVSSVMRFFE